MNQIICIGRLTKDVEIKYTESGLAVARFNIALDRGKDKDGNDKGADFPSCVAFGRTAENLEKYSGKGLKIAVNGHIQTGSYEKDGQKVYTTDIICDRIEFIDWKEKSESERIADAKPAANQEGVPDGFEALDDDDVPF